ncbi:tRNA dimethylallyltransferase 9-like [Dorcoceras hygrometricum]|uniref:malate dehydrogenase n=1 Tax=Dorcoceras hygrometricum TaxID=472368 RepID=A0A2Z7AG08_9LAMI|nr:tRNA dimethylallyltransferase 9-like [Dorcoceras hygrometricum]
MMGGLRVGGLRVSSLRLPFVAEPPLLLQTVKTSVVTFHNHHISRHCTVNCSSDAQTKKGQRQKVIVISGPTGAGKSRLSLELAKRLNGEIISADSVQVYRGLDIGSAKPSISERREVAHHLIDILHPTEDYSVGQFYEDARQITEEILSKGRVPIVSGGTGLYLRWFIYGKPNVPKASPEIASEVHSELSGLQRDGDWAAAVQLVVKAGDPGVQSLAANDWYRLRRRFEILKLSGASSSSFPLPYDSFKEKLESREVESLEIKSSVDDLHNSESKELDFDFICFFLSTNRLDLYRSIDFRCEDMLVDGGILTEAQWLLDLGLMPNSNSATRAIGYRQAMDYLLACREQGSWSSSRYFYTFLSEFQKASRNFAKRQLTWFRNEPIYQWIDAAQPMENVLSFICDSYHVQNGNLKVPRSLSMKKDVSNHRDVQDLKAYRTKNRHFITREDCGTILEWPKLLKMELHIAPIMCAVRRWIEFFIAKLAYIQSYEFAAMQKKIEKHKYAGQRKEICHLCHQEAQYISLTDIPRPVNQDLVTGINSAAHYYSCESGNSASLLLFHFTQSDFAFEQVEMKAGMLRSVLRRNSSSSTTLAASSYVLRRGFSSESAPERKVTILGAAGGIGQPLSLLMKLNPLVSKLALYDIAGTPGVAADVSHINTRSEVAGYAAEEQLGQALEGSDIVIIPAGVPRKPGMTRDDLFKINAGIVKSLCEAIAKYSPKALVNMISNPVNSTVPIAAEVFKSKGVYDEKRLFGVTTLDVVRAKTFYAGKANVNVAGVNVPVVGGHAGITILPLFSQATPKANLSDDIIKALTKRTQDGGTEVVEAKAGKGSATLSMAYAGAIFADACLKGLNGVPDVVECSFVQSTVTELPFFASKVRLGKNGVEEVLGLGPLSDYEQQGLEALKPELKSSIEKEVLPIPLLELG